MARMCQCLTKPAAYHAHRGCPHLLCHVQLALSHDQRAGNATHAGRARDSDATKEQAPAVQE